PGAFLDHRVDIEERHAQFVREQPPDGRLARAHEADEDDHDELRSGECRSSSAATARSASTYPPNPKPAMIPSATGVITDSRRKPSRAAMLEMCTSTSGAVRIFSASIRA